VFAIIGIVVVFGCILAGYLMEHGNVRVLLQPAELVIIGGAAIGTVRISNPLHIIKKIAAGIVGVFGSSKFGKQVYIDSLRMMYQLLNKARKDGLLALEADVEDPAKSAIFSKNPILVNNPQVCAFVCDSLRMAITGVDAFDLDQMLDLDLEVHHQDALQPTLALSTTADALPGLGIVAAVLGVVITMGALGGPPEEIGHKVAAALVGTFLGVLLCYGLVGPLASNMAKAAVGGYFKDPTGTAKKVGSNMAGAGENFLLTRDNMPRLKEQLQQTIRQMDDFEKLKNHIEMTVTAEGLRIELSESATGTFFDSGSAKLNADGREMLTALGKNSARFLIRSPSKATPIRTPTPLRPITETGNCPAIAPTPRGG
jgi:chemotaxis protein MotA